MLDDLLKRLPSVEEVTVEIYDTASRCRMLRSLRRLLVAIEDARSRDLERAIRDCPVMKGSDVRLTHSDERSDSPLADDPVGGDQ